METVDITIIGAGVIGLSIASEIAGADKDIFILEKNDSWGQETSSRNSEVIHAGIYYDKDSLKAISCVEGREMLYSLCKENDISFKKTGKLIVAQNKDEIEYLEDLQKKAEANGVELSFLDKKEIKQMEPDVSGITAAYSPETGIIDSHFLMKYFLEKAKSNGAELVCDAELVCIEKKGGTYLISVNNQGEEVTIESRVVINCAGNNADKIAAMAGIDIKKCGYEQYFLKGNYFRLSDKFRNKTHHLVYPVPTSNSLGIHTVLDLSGGIRLGPDAEEVEEFDYRVNESKKDEFYESVKQFLPCIDQDSLYPDMAGIRPQLRRPNIGDFKDFIISHEDSKGLPGFINLIGIESPGLTASPYIAKYVADIIKGLS
jgi:L-2-hydroxyglutarate oxidase LhgO